MLKSKPIFFAVASLLMVSLACATPSVSISTPDANVIGTLIAQTLAVAGTQTGQAVIPVNAEASPTSTFTVIPTATATLSPTPELTATPEVPLISVSVATNCRVGPGRVYDRVGALLVGDVAEVFGKDSSGEYWYIRNPAGNPEFCWLWGRYASLVGNILTLPIYTPPPTPTPVPAFEASYRSLGACVDSWWMDLNLKNTGGVTFKSVSITVRDIDTDTVLLLTADGFKDKDACPGSTTKPELIPEATIIFSTPVFLYNPAGHKIRATITVCSEIGLSGLCASQVINFKP